MTDTILPSVLPYASVDHLTQLLGLMKQYAILASGEHCEQAQGVPDRILSGVWADPDYKTLFTPEHPRFRNTLLLAAGDGKAQQCPTNCWRHINAHPERKLLALPGFAVWEHTDKLEGMEDLSLEPHLVLLNLRSRIAKDVTARPGFTGKVHFVPVSPSPTDHGPVTAWRLNEFDGEIYDDRPRQEVIAARRRERGLAA